MADPNAAAAPAQPVEQPTAPPVTEAAAPPSVGPDFSAYEAAENAKALGKPAPVTAPAPPPADATVTPPADDTAPKGLERFVTTPPPPGVSKRQHAINEVLRHTEELRLENERLRAGTAPRVAVPPAAPSVPAQDYDGSDLSDPEPTIDQFADRPDPYAAHLRAQIKWEDRKEARAQAFRTQQTAAQTELQTRVSEWIGRREAFAATNPNFRTKAGALLDALQANTPIGDAIMDSPIGPQLALHLAEHPAEFQRLSGLHWRAQLREVGKLEASLSTAPAASAPPGAPTPKLVSSAPAPPPILGTRPAEPADSVAAAISRHDFSAFDAEQTARDLAAAGRR